MTDRELALMSALRYAFPHSQNFLCHVHISRNVLSKCKKLFSDGKVWNFFISRFNELVTSVTKAEYSCKLQEFQTAFSDYSEAVFYVMENWLFVYKVQFVSTWTDHFTHFWNTIANRVESVHNRLKMNLGSLQGNLSLSWNAIHQILLINRTCWN